MTKENNKIKKNKFSIKTIVLWMLVILSVIILCANVGKYVAEPLNFGIEAEGVTDYDSNGDTNVIVDKEYQRMVILNKNFQVKDVKEVSIMDEEIYTISDIAVSNDFIYSHKYSLIKNTSFIKSEIVEQYDLNGNYKGKLWEENFNLEDKQALTTKIIDIYSTNNYLNIIFLNDNDEGFTTYKFEESDNLDRMRNSAQVKTYNTPNVFIAGVRYIESEGCYYIIDLDRCLYKLNPDDSSIQEIDRNISLSTKKVSITEDGHLKEDDLTWLEGTTFSNSALLQVKISAFWASAIFLGIVIIFLIGKYIHYLIIRRKYTLLKRITYVLIIFLSLTVIVCVYSVSLKNKYDESSQKVVEYSNDMVYYNLDDEIKSYLGACASGEKISIEVRNKISEYLGKLSLVASQNEYDILYGLSYYQDGALVTASTSGCSLKNEHKLFEKIFQDVNIEDDKIVSNIETSKFYKSFLVMRPVYDDQNNFVGFFTTANNVDSLDSVALHEIINVALLLLVTAIILSFILVEGKENIDLLITKYKMRQKGKAEHEILLARLIMFLVIAAASVDSAIVTLIAKDMINEFNLDYSEIAYVLPVFVTSCSYILGSGVYYILCKYLRAKVYNLCCSVIALFSFVMCAFSVYIGNFVSLLIFVFIANCSLQAILRYSQGLPLHAKAPEVRARINRSLTTTMISAYSISTLIAGFFAEIFGNFSVYLISIAPLIALILVILFLAPHKSISDSKNEKNKNRKVLAEDTGILKFILSPVILLGLFAIILPYGLSSAYKSVLYPLLADVQGLSKSTISVIVVLCSALTFFTSPILDKLEEKFEGYKILIIGSILLALVFIISILNRSLIWGTIILVVSIIVTKILIPPFTTLWQNEAIRCKVDKKGALSVITAFDSVCRTISSPIIGILAWIAGFAATFIIGIYCAVTSFLMSIALINKRKKKDKN